MEWQDFGQKVSLTARIRELLLNYPEGTSIFKELLQNADDAKATSVNFCLDHRSHATESLAFPSLAPYQGPALLVHNDAQFTEADFDSIRHIGDSLKKGQTGKTGRYGLGFNSVYHLTDLPAFVSGKYLVLFDPHCSILPNASAANPGKRIDFTASNFAASAPSTCAAFTAFGCDMQHPFDGTLFRFALRTEAMAKQSGISTQTYASSRLRELLMDLQGEAHMLLLFLKTVEQLRVWEWLPGEREPSLLFECAVRNPSPALRHERSMFARTAQAFSALAAAKPGQGAASSEAELQRALASSTLVSAQYRLVVESRGPADNRPTQWEYLIAQGCGGKGTQAWDLAVQLSKDMGIALVPWGAVAAPLHAPSSAPGHVFCFLPLPASSGLPVHINGTFELSSNRRDLWHGSDLLGIGRKRAAWNATLLGEVVGPLYSSLLATLAPRLGPTDQYFELWPTSIEALRSRDALAALVDPWLHAISAAPVAHTNAGGGRWLPPESGIFLDDRAARNDDLLQALLQLGLPVVSMPLPISRLLIQHALLRPDLLSPSMLRERARTADALRILPTLSTRLAAALLDFASSDVMEDDPDSVCELFGLPVLPLLNGSLVAMRPPGQQSLFLPGPQEVELFQAAAHCLLDPNAINAEMVQRLRVIAKLQCSSLRLVDAAAVAEVLVQHVLPPSFRGKHQVPWDRQKPPPQWLLQLWEWLRQQQDSSAALLTFTAWPIVPTQQGTLVAPCRTARSTLILGPKEHGEWTPELTFALTKLGCGIVDASALGSADGLAASTAHPPDASGVLCALQNCLARQKATSTSAWLDSAGILPAERDALLQLLARRQWFERSRQLQPEQVQFMRSLPIYASAAGYVELHTAQRYLPPPDLHAALRGCNQLFTNKALLKLCGRETESVLIDFLGVKQLTKAVFYKKSVLPTLHRLDATVSEAVAVEILREVPLLQQADRTVVDALRSSPIVTTAGGGTAQPQELYDPRNSELVAFLDPAASFPSGKFGPVLDQLTQLGMRTTAGRDTILLAASQIQDLATSEKAPLAAARSRALLAYLDAHAARLQAASSSRESAEQANGFQLEAVFSRVANLLTGEGQQPEANSRATEEANNREAQEFWETLRQVSWCPVSQDCPLPGLPWCGQGQNATTAPPTAVRPRKDLWLASSQRCILDGEVRSAVLLKAMGWDASLPPSVLAAQLGALGAAFTHVSDTAARQQLAEVAPQLYRALSKLPPAALESVRSKIGEDPCIWIGDGFAPVSKVALRGPLNLSSAGVYVIPLELAPFKDVLLALGIPASFSSSQYIGVLASMHEATADQPLDEARLEQALGIAAALADMPIPTGVTVYLPDDKCVLRPVSSLLYNDAPWTETVSVLEGSTFVHRSIANDVADRLGVASMRRVLLSQGADALPFALTGSAVEAFGQSEALTTRLRHILESYADGPGALMELMQNADDAGASQFRLMLDLSTYSSDRLLGPKLAPWQGPALLAWNDAVFTAADVQSIAKIGQDSKLTRPGATGRFGLGFNSVFHWTDLPSFVSGDLLVCFDPHAAFLPGVTPAQPGIKIRFPSSPLLEHFPDSFAPYRVFGCDLKGAYSGTLFRFPLRTERLATTSDIKPKAYSPEDVQALFKAFREEALHALLFLKSVSRAELWVKEAAGTEPRLIFAVEAEGKGAKANPQHEVAQFVRGAGGSSKDGQFYKRLGDEKSLPVACEPIVVRAWEDTASTPTSVHRWLACDLLARGQSLQLALQAAGKQRGWVPWAGVAAPIDEGAQLDGRAFCFLPLPAYTHLPVHVNGFFELSSNRRDLWSGIGLSGDAKQRADWNLALLKDGVGVAYVQVLLAATREGVTSSAVYNLWPSLEAVQTPWDLVASAVYDLVLSQPVLWTGAAGGEWVAPSAAVFLLADSHVAEPALTERVAALLLSGGIPVVSDLPATIADTLLQRHPVLRGSVLTPEYLRQHLRSTRQVPGGSAGSKDEIQRAVDCLAYCLADAPWTLGRGQLVDLTEVPLVPLVDGTLGALNINSKARTLLLPTAAEHTELLQAKLASTLIAVQPGRSLFEHLRELAKSGAANVQLLDAAGAVQHVLPAYLPAHWQGHMHVAWDPESFTGSEPNKQCIVQLWDVLSTGDVSSSTTAQGLAAWPLIPAMQHGSSILAAASPAAGLILEGSWTEATGQALAQLGCAFVSPSIVATLPEPLKAACIFSATGRGVLSALAHLWSAADGQLKAAGLSAEERDGLRAFLLQARWFDSAQGVVEPQQLAVLKTLPIYRCCGLNSADVAQQYTNLDGDGVFYLAPRGFRAAAALPSSFLQASPGEADVLQTVLGIEECSVHDALVDHALPRASQLDTPSLEALVLPLFKEVARKHCPAALVAALQTSPCIAVGSPAEGRRVLPSECYDPRNQGLKDLVGDDAAFPLDSWASDAELLQALEMLGMRTTVNPDTLASIARKLQQDAEDDAVTKQTLERRAGALLQALDHLVSQSTPDSGPAEGFWAELEQIAFLPVHAQPPLQGLPWPEGGVQETLAPPRRVRLESAAWLVSASLRLLKGPCSEALAEKLGLNAPPPPKVLTAQLLGLGYAHAHVSDAELQHTLEGASAEIFSQLNSSEVLDGPLGEVVLELLRSGPTIWVDDGYVAPSQVAIDTPRNFKPWLHAVPESLASSSALLSAIGVPATPTPVQYVQALGRMADELGMGDTLLEDNLLTAIALTECLGSALVGASPRAALQADIVKTAVLPDAEGAFAPASQLYINDAPWLAHEDLRMVHPDVPTEAAAALGAQSLRLHHQVETQTSERLPCPPAALLRQLLQSQGDPAILALWDIIEMADACGCTRVEVHFDERTHGTQSVLQPGLAAFQCPAICFNLPGVVLSPEELCRLQSPPTPFRLRQGLCRFGCGLLNAYLIADVVQIISGESLLLFDPAAQHLSLESTGGQGPGGASDGLGHAKQYRHAGTDLVRRFSDQFSVWDWSGENVASRVNGTLIRLPLRTEKQANGVHALAKAAFGVDEAIQLLADFSSHASQSLLFADVLTSIKVKRCPTSNGSPGGNADAVLLHEATIKLPFTAGAAGQTHSHRSWCEEREWRQNLKASGGFLSAMTKQFGWLGGREDSSSGKTRGGVESDDTARRFVEHTVSVFHNGERREESWAVATCAGAGGSGSMAADKRYQHLNLNPQAAVAVRVAVSKGSGATAEPSSGLLAAFPLPGAKRSETAGLEKLPFTVCANFALSRAGQRRPTAFQPESTSHESESSASETTDHVKGRFNTSLLTCVGLAAVGLLERLVMRHSQLDCTGLYNMLPTASLPGSLPEVATLAAQLSTLVAKKRMWKLRRGHVAMLVQGCFLQSATSLGGLSTEAGSFLQERLPLFEVPETVMPWLEAWGVQGIRSVSAAVVRTELKALAAANALANTTLFTPSVAAELLLFATSDVAVVPEDAEAESVVDLDALAACKGLPCLDATGAVQFIGSRTLYVLDPAQPDPTALFAAHPRVLKAFIHPEVASRVGALFQRPASANALGVKPYALEHVPGHLAQVLPSHWAPAGIGSDAPMSVPWRDGAVGGPTPDWLQQLWTFLLTWQGASAPNATTWVDPFAGWTLLPVGNGDVMRMAFRHTVITPPLQENTSVIDADLPPAWADAWTTKLVPALQEMGCSVLDPRFAACSTLCNSAYSEEARGDAAGEDARLVAKLRANSDLGQLATANLSPVGRHTVLEWLAQRASAGPPLSGIDREFLRSLPIYPTLDGGVAAIEGGSSPAHGAVNTAVYAAVAGSDGALPPALLRQLLSCKPELEGLYNALGVQLLSASELLVVILRWEGGFAGLSRSTQNACVGLMASKWEELQESHCCVEAMAAAAFVSTANGSLACPRDLYDPSLPLLASIFAGQAVFPHGRFATPAWLDILRTLGLRRALTRDTFLEAARQVSARVKEVCDKAGGGRALASPGQLLSPEGVQVWEAACALARHLADDEGSRLLLGGEGRQFASELREIAYVPTKVYFPGVATAASTLATCAELVLPADAPLAWTGAPVLDAASAPPPPASANAPLRIRSPPPFDSVAAHLSLVGTAGGEGTLACWPFPDHTPAEACQRVLSYFESEGLTERQLQRLQGVALVPVSNGARLVAPSALFLRTPVDMRPLAYELPPSFVSGLPVLKQLGLKDAPSNADLLAILGALPGARRLTTPQLTAVGRLLHHLLVESSAPEALAAASRGHITVPTALGILVPPHACIWADASLWDVVPRLSGTQINVVHPLVSPAVCKALGIASLADVMEEKLDASHDEAPVSAIQGVTPDDLSARLRDPSVAAAVHAALLAQQRWAVAAETKSYSSAGPKTLEEVAHALAQVAAGLRFVQTCHTVLQLSSKGASRVLEGSASQVACHAEPGCLVLAAEPAAAFSAAVAAAVSKLLRAPSLLPIAPLFEAPADLLAATARIISGVDGSSRAATTANNTAITSSTLTAAAAAGQLGAVLTPGDSAAARLLPLRRYAAGELVALRMPTGQLRYARIAADSGPLPGMAAYKATIEISPGKFRDILSSEIMALGSAGEEEDATGMPGSQAEVNSAIESVDSAGDVRGRASVPEKVAAGEDVAGASPAEIAGALRSMLTAAGLPLDPNSAELLEQTLTLRQRLQSTEGQLAAAATERAKAEEAAAEMRTAWQCRICLQREVNTVSVACGHLLCNVCAAALPRPACPFCRKTSQMQRLYR